MTITKNIKLQMPFAPSLALRFKKEEYNVILYTYGGGMGGAAVRLYTKDTIDTNKDFIEITNHLGCLVKLNTRFIVSINKCNLYMLDIKNMGNSWVGKVGETKRYIYAFPLTHNVKLSNDTSGDSCKDNLLESFVI